MAHPFLVRFAKGLRRQKATVPVNVDPDRYMIFATRARMPSGTQVTAAEGNNVVLSKIVVNTPSYPVNDFRLHFSGFALTEGGNSPQETVLSGNPLVIHKVFAMTNGELIQAKFSGADGLSIASGAKGSWIDNLKFSKPVPAESAVTIFTLYSTAVGEKQIPVYRIQKHRGERVWSAGDVATLEAKIATPNAESAGSLDINYGVQGQPQVYGPDFMVAKGWDGRPVAVVTADSIGEARQEYGPSADARGNLGWVRRWLDKKGGIGRIPHIIMGVPGAAAYRELTGSGASIATMRWDILDEVTAMNGGKPPFTILLNQMGQNDTNSVINTFWARISGLFTRSKTRYPDVPVVSFTPFGRSSSSNVYADTAGQTFAAQNFYPAVAGDTKTGKWIMRENILGNVSGNLDGSIDTFAAWSSAERDGVWPSRAELPATSLAADAEVGATTVVVSNGSVISPEQTVIFASGMQRAIFEVDGNTLRFNNPLTSALAAGASVEQIPTLDQVHPQPVMVRRIVDKLPQSRKALFATLAPAPEAPLPASIYGLVSATNDGSVGQTYTGPAWSSPQWYRETLDSSKVRAVIDGATGRSYVSQSADVGFRLVMSGVSAGVTKVAASWAPVFPAPVVIESFDAKENFSTTGGPRLTIDIVDKVQGTGSLVQEMLGSATRLIKTIGPLTGFPGISSVDDLGTIAYLCEEIGTVWGRSDVGMGALRLDQTTGTPSNSGFLSPSYQGRMRRGKVWLSAFPKSNAYLQGKDPAASWRFSFDRSSAAANTPFSSKTRVDALVAKAQGRGTVVIGFDDGFTTQLDIAAKDLANAGMAGTFYIPTKVVSDSTGSSRLNWDRCRQLFELDMDLQLDGTDNDASMITKHASPTAAVAELRAMRIKLMTEVPGTDPRHICYPNGHISIYSVLDQNDHRNYVGAVVCTPGATTTVVTGIIGTAKLSVGQTMDGYDVPANTKIVSVDNANQVTVDKVVPSSVVNAAFYDEAQPFFLDKLQEAMRADGTIYTARTTGFASYLVRFGFGATDMYLPAYSLSNGANGTLNDDDLADAALARIDAAIERGEVIEFYIHGIQVGGTFITTPLATWQRFLAGLIQRRDAGLCDVMTKAQLWAAYGQATYPGAQMAG